MLIMQSFVQFFIFFITCGKMIIFNPLSKIKGRVLYGFPVIIHCYDWLTPLLRKQYQRPLTIVFRQHDQNKAVISRQSIIKYGL